MAKLGDEKYPELSVDDAIEAAEILVNDFGGDVGSEEAFAQSLGHSSASSGTYYTKIADIRRYGVLPSRGYEATELANRIANPRSEQEKSKAIYDMLRGVPILSEIYESLNGNEPPDEFWRILTEVTNTNPKEAREAAPTLREQYRRLRDAEKRESEEDKRQNAESQSKDQSKTRHTSSDSAIYIKVGNEELRLSEVNDVYIGIAQDFLERLKSEESQANKPKNSEDDSQSKLM